MLWFSLSDYFPVFFLSEHRGVRFVNLSSNSFRGEIQDSFSPSSSLVELNLESNAFTGPIPSSFESISGLISLRLQLNWFNGVVPEAICSLRAFENGYRSGLQTLGADCLPNRGITDNLCTCCTDCCDRNSGDCQSVDDSLVFQEGFHSVCDSPFRWDSQSGEVTTV